MKCIYLVTCLLIYTELTSAANKHRYSSRSQKYPDVLLLLDENDVLDEMFDQALREFNNGDEVKNHRKKGETEDATSGNFLLGEMAGQSSEYELQDRTSASGESVAGSDGSGFSGEGDKHHHEPVRQMDTGCGCVGESCECCLQVDITDANGDACVKVTLLRSEIGLQFAVTWKGEIAFSKTISAINPPSICFSIPFVRFLKGCVRFSDISYLHDKFGGCISLGLRLLAVKKEFQLGCFYTSNATALGPIARNNTKLLSRQTVKKKHKNTLHLDLPRMKSRIKDRLQNH